METFKDLSSDSPVSSPREVDSMSFKDKVDRWNLDNEEDLKSPTTSQDVDIDEGNSLDELDEAEQLPGVLGYRKLIEESWAYRWLLSQLRCKTALSTTSPNIKQAIRDSILRALPKPPEMSRTGHTELIKSTYEVHWDILVFLERQQYKEELAYAVENAITLTGDVENTQAETCIGYLEQTWPLTGEYLIQVLKRVVQAAEGTHHTCERTLFIPMNL